MRGAAMSFDMFVLMIRLDGVDFFERAIAERAFARYVDDLESGEWHFRKIHGESYGTRILIAEGQLIDGLSINRPPSYEKWPDFWNALYDVLRQTRTFLLWPDAGQRPHYCVGNPVFLDEFPSEYVTEHGKPAVASSGAELETAVSGVSR
jgi:hypothetical protein